MMSSENWKIMSLWGVKKSLLKITDKSPDLHRGNVPAFGTAWLFHAWLENENLLSDSVLFLAEIDS